MIVLPQESSELAIKYFSSKLSVAAIDNLGNISALSSGSTTITVSAGEINKSFELQVVEKEETVNSSGEVKGIAKGEVAILFLKEPKGFGNKRNQPPILGGFCCIQSIQIYTKLYLNIVITYPTLYNILYTMYIDNAETIAE